MVRWPLQPLQPLQKTQLQPPVSPSVDSLCHPWFTTTNLSYRFPMFETSATALCGTTDINIEYMYIYNYVCVWCLQCGIIMKQLIHFEHVRITPIHWCLFWSCRDWRRLGGTPVQRQQQNFHRGWGPIQELSAVVDSSVDSTSTESEIYEIDKGFQRLRCPSLIYNIYIYI